MLDGLENCPGSDQLFRDAQTEPPGICRLRKEQRREVDSQVGIATLATRVAYSLPSPSGPFIRRLSSLLTLRCNPKSQAFVCALIPKTHEKLIVCSDL
jgi:hypothetical protein